MADADYDIEKVDIDVGVSQVVVYTNYSAISIAYKDLRPEMSLKARHDVVRNLVVSAMIQVLPSLKSQHVIVRKAKGAKSTAPQALICFQLGFEALCHITKQVTDKNREYLGKRWKACEAALQSKGLIIGKYRYADNIIPLLNHLPDISTLFPPANVIKALRICMNRNDCGSTRQALHEQLLMVYGKSQMTTIELMADFFRNPTNGSLIIPSVVSVLEKFKAAYLHAKEQMPAADWPISRALHPVALIELESRKYPDLNLAVSEATNVVDGFNRANFQTSTHKTIAPPKLIKKHARTQLH